MSGYSASLRREDPFEIAKLTEDVIESAIDPKECHQESRRVKRQFQIIHDNVKRFGH